MSVGVHCVGWDNWALDSSGRHSD